MSEDDRTADLIGGVIRAQSTLHARMGEHVERQKERLRATAKTKKSADTRRRIMETATQLMVERGNSAFQMSEVSRRCGMSKGALYYYFSDKEDLVNAIFDAAVENLARGIDAVVAQAQTPEEALMGICSEFAKQTSGGSPLPMAIVRELVQSREGTIRREDMRVMHIICVLSELLDRAKANGTVRAEVDSKMGATAICGGFTFGALSAMNEGAENAEFTSYVLDMVIHGLGARA